MSAKCNSNTAPDILQLNMEIISKELNDLIVTGEQEFGMAQHFQMATVKTTTHSFMTAPAIVNNLQVPTYITNAFYGQQPQQICGANSIQPIKPNLNYYQTIQQPVPYGNIANTLGNVAGTSNMITPLNYLCADKYLGHSTLRSNQSPYANTSTSTSPSYEFHYLRENEKKSTSMSSLGSQGAFRKASKISPRHFTQKTHNSAADNEDIKIDLSSLDFFNKEKENFAVRHLFELLRDLHRAVAETLPSFELDSDSQYEETFAPSATKKSTMPSTLNVQNQVKQACRKLTIFTHEMQSILSANKMFDAEMHAECEFYLNQLRQYLSQLELYKRIVMEHKHGKFLREEVKVHAERLSLLLEHTNRQIREVHIRILAVDWYIGVKYRGDVHVAAMQFNTDKEFSKKSKIGVINEILQMCNTTTNQITTTTTETTNTQAEISKPETLINCPAKLLENQEVVKVKTLTNRNNEVLNVCKPDQTKRLATLVNTTTITTHTRHPFFYIG